jgi:hypothetical protein
MVEGAKEPTLPVFGLAPLRTIDPARLLSKDKATPFESFMLTLALFYNDWKGLAWMKEAILEPQRPGPALTAYRGQWAGLLIQIARLQFGTLHEFMNLLKVEREVAEGREVGLLIASIPKASRDSWKTLVAIALGKGANQDPLANALVRIRNAVAFHYHQPKTLVRGFQDYFFQNPIEDKNAAAYYSIGDDMEATRFYYADAAANMAVKSQGDAAGAQDLSERASKAGNEVNKALATMLQRYLSERSRGPAPGKENDQ